jgi:hypothetical protein
MAAQHQTMPQPARPQTVQQKMGNGTEQQQPPAATAHPTGALRPASQIARTSFSQGNRHNGNINDTTKEPFSAPSITRTIHIADGKSTDTTREPVDIPGIMRISHIEYDSADIARNRARETSADTALNINGIGALELTPQELAQLGIEVTSTGLRLFAEEKYNATDPRITKQLYRLGYDTTQPEFIKRYNIQIDTFSVELNTVTNPTQNRYSRIVPIAIYNQYTMSESREGSHLSYFNRSPLLTELITNYHGSADAMKNEVFTINSPKSISEAQQGMLHKSPLASKLIPIHVRMGNQLIPGTTRQRGADIYLWYYPTHEFIAALPDRYRNTLQEELEALADVEADRMKSSEACQCLPGGPTVLGICRLSSGAVTSASLFPNPAQGSTTLQFRLTQPRYVTITLNDLSGRYLRTLESGQELNMGDYPVALKLGEVQSGTYLVVVRTDRGEQAVQRLIVQ